MRAILSLAQYYGRMIGNAWHYLLATLQVSIPYCRNSYTCHDRSVKLQ